MSNQQEKPTATTLVDTKTAAHACAGTPAPEQLPNLKEEDDGESILEPDEYATLKEAAEAIGLNNAELRELITSHEKARIKEACLHMLLGGDLKLKKETTGEVDYILNR